MEELVTISIFGVAGEEFNTLAGVMTLSRLELDSAFLISPTIW